MPIDTLLQVAQEMVREASDWAVLTGLAKAPPNRQYCHTEMSHKRLNPQLKIK